MYQVLLGHTPHLSAECPTICIRLPFPTLPHTQVADFRARGQDDFHAAAADAGSGRKECRGTGGGASDGDNGGPSGPGDKTGGATARGMPVITNVTTPTSITTTAPTSTAAATTTTTAAAGATSATATATTAGGDKARCGQVRAKTVSLGLADLRAAMTLPGAQQRWCEDDAEWLVRCVLCVCACAAVVLCVVLLLLLLLVLVLVVVVGYAGAGV